MKILSVTRKTLLEAWRDPKLFGLLLIFPALMVAIYFVAFGDTGQGLGKMLKVLVLNQDQGSQGARLVQALRSQEFDGEAALDLAQVSSRQSAGASLRERKASLLLVIPPDFTTGLQAGQPPELELVGDPNLDLYMFASMSVRGIAEDFSRQITGQPPVLHQVQYEFVEGTGTMSDLQFGVPGVLVFGVLFGVIAAATVLVREDVSGALKRLRLTRLSAFDLITGITLAHAVLAALQVPLALAVAWFMGFRTPGSLLLAVSIGVLLSLTSTGMGLIAACFAHSDGEAANWGTLLLMPLAFLSGAVFPMPSAPMLKLGQHTLEWYDLMPTAPAAEAMRRVMIYGDGFSDVSFELLLLGLLSVFYLALGVVIYHHRRLRPL